MVLCCAMRAYLLGLAVVLLISSMCCRAQTKIFTLPTSAMEPTIMQGEKFTAEMKPFQPTRGDLIILDHGGQLLVKRVIGITGDTVEGRDLQVFVNGKLLEESYVEHVGRHPADPKSLETFGPIAVPAGKLFVAGDNRDYSFDSRDARFGLISSADIKGRPIEIVLSPNPERIHRVLK